MRRGLPGGGGRCRCPREHLGGGDRGRRRWPPQSQPRTFRSLCKPGQNFTPELTVQIPRKTAGRVLDDHGLGYITLTIREIMSTLVKGHRSWILVSPALWCGKGIKAPVLWWAMPSSALLPAQVPYLGAFSSPRGKAAWPCLVAMWGGLTAEAHPAQLSSAVVLNSWPHDQPPWHPHECPGMCCSPRSPLDCDEPLCRVGEDRSRPAPCSAVKEADGQS